VTFWPSVGDLAVDREPLRADPLFDATREPRPRCARNFWSRSATPGGVGRGRCHQRLRRRRRGDQPRGRYAGAVSSSSSAFVVRGGVELLDAVLGDRRPALRHDPLRLRLRRRSRDGGGFGVTGRCSCR
jgi:hypothetical protein